MNARQLNRVLLILVASFMILGCGAGQAFFSTPTPYPTYTPPAPPRLSETVLVGQWEEYWGVGDRSDVTYHDVYEMTLGEEKEVQITCPDRPDYKFEKITFDGTTLNVRLDNEGFFIDYVLTFAEDQTLLTGTAKTKNDTYRVVWAKLK